MIDGFDMAQVDGTRPGSNRLADAFLGLVHAVGRPLGVAVHGLERLPNGRALVVANHAFGWDVAFPIAAIARSTGRKVWALGEHLWWKIPVVRRLAASVGVVDGRREVA